MRWTGRVWKNGLGVFLPGHVPGRLAAREQWLRRSRRRWRRWWWRKMIPAPTAHVVMMAAGTMIAALISVQLVLLSPYLLSKPGLLFLMVS